MRQAGILGLEMLARDNLDDYFNPVQKVLCSFLRDGSAAHPPAIGAPANALRAGREFASAHLPVQADYRTAFIALSRLCERARVRKLAVEGQFDLAGLGLKVGKRRRPPEKRLPDAREIGPGPRLIDAPAGGPTGPNTETVQTIAPSYNEVIAARQLQALQPPQEFVHVTEKTEPPVLTQPQTPAPLFDEAANPARAEIVQSEPPVEAARWKKLRKWKKEPPLKNAAQPAAKTEKVNAGPAQKGTSQEVVIPRQPPVRANPVDEQREVAKRGYAYAEPTGSVRNGADGDAAPDAAALLESLDETLEQIRLSLSANARQEDADPAA